MFSFMASYLLFWKTIWIEKKIWSMKIFKNNRKCSKTLLFSAATWIAFLAWKTLKFDFLYFWKSCRELNFLSKNTNPESIGSLSRKFEPKYETGAEDNTNSASSSTFFQNFKWGSLLGFFLFNLVYIMYHINKLYVLSHVYKLYVLHWLEFMISYIFYIWPLVWYSCLNVEFA